jgi:quercetin dioxygenase-like cupin family protein
VKEDTMMTLQLVETEPLAFLDNVARVHVDGDASGGAYGLVEMTGPAGDMPPVHVHHRDDEAFYVLEGRLTLFVGEQTTELEAGACALAPRGVPHTYRAGTDGARWLVAGSPAGFETFVREVAAAPGADPSTVAELAARHGIELLGPPGKLPTEL